MRRLQKLLAREADPSYAATVHKYMKEIMPCRGIKMPAIKSTVEEWKQEAPAVRAAVHMCMCTIWLQASLQARPTTATCFFIDLAV